MAEYRHMQRQLVDMRLMAVCATPGCSIAFVPASRRQRFHSVACRQHARQLAEGAALAVARCKALRTAAWKSVGA